MRDISQQIMPMFLKADPSGRRLVLSYQSGGPGGRSGHDAVEVYDTHTEKLIGTLTGFPRVGGPISVSSGGELALLDGWDACSHASYDHNGCPFTPSRIFQVLRLTDFKVQDTLTLSPDTNGGAYTEIVALQPCGGLGLTAEAYTPARLVSVFVTIDDISAGPDVLDCPVECISARS